MLACVRNLPWVVYLVAALCFIYLPVVVLVLFSFQEGILPVFPFTGPSLQWYEKMFANERLVESLVNSVLVAVLSSLVTTILGFLSAYTLARYKPRFARAMQFFLMAPLMVSYLIIGMGLLISCLLYTSPSPRDAHESRMPSSA